MKRRLFNILSVLALLLFVALGVLWMRSYWVRDALICIAPVRGNGDLCYLAASFDHGSMDVWYARVGPREVSMSAGLHYDVSAAGITDSPAHGRFGFGYSYDSDTESQLRIPSGAAMLAAILPVGWWFIRERRRRAQLQHDRCLQCGYDLRASKERCPECGTPVPVRAGKSIGEA